jgi:hypothetical protein
MEGLFFCPPVLFANNFKNISMLPVKTINGACMFLKAFFITCLGISSLLLGNDPVPFAPTIPVVDFADFHNPETKARFVQEVAKAMHEVGFFGVVNPEIDAETLNAAYDVSASSTAGTNCKT